MLQKYNGDGDTPLNLTKGRCKPGSGSPIIDPDTNRVRNPDRPDDDAGASRLVSDDGNSDGALTYRDIISWDASCDPNTGNNPPVLSSDITIAKGAPLVDIKFGQYDYGLNRNLFFPDPNAVAIPYKLADLSPQIDKYGQSFINQPNIQVIRQGGRFVVTATLQKKNGGLVRLNLQRDYDEVCSVESGSGDLAGGESPDSGEFSVSIKP